MDDLLVSLMRELRLLGNAIGLAWWIENDRLGWLMLLLNVESLLLGNLLMGVKLLELSV